MRARGFSLLSPTSTLAMFWQTTFIIMSIAMTIIECQKLNPNETAPNFVMSTVDGPLIYKGVNGKGSSTGNHTRIKKLRGAVRTFLHCYAVFLGLRRNKFQTVRPNLDLFCS